MKIPKYSKHSSGNARVRLGGQVFYLGKYGTQASKDAYNRLVGEFIATGGVVITEDAKADLTICEMFSAYLGWAKQNYGANATEFLKAKLIVKRTRERYRGTEASKFGYQQFEAIRQSLVEQGLTRGYVNASMDRLVKAFKWAASRGLIAANVPQSLSMIERLKQGRTKAHDNPRIGVVPREVVEATLPHVSKIVGDMIQLQAIIGCRPGELCRIQPGMIDRTNDVWEITLVQHKTAHHGRTRVIYVGPRGQAILAPYLLRPADQHCFRPVDSERARLKARASSRTTPMSCGNRTGTNRKSKPKRSPREFYGEDSFARAIHRGCDRAFPPPAPLARQDNESDLARWKRLTPKQTEELKAWQKAHRWSPNRLRHLFGTEIRKTSGIEAASLLLGHSDLETSKIYAEADRQKAVDAARKVG